jgi:hypothetical protein
MNKSLITSIDSLYRLYGSSTVQDIINISLIPLGLIGIGLNILSLIILRSNGARFKQTFYTYLRAYTICSIFICFLNATQFTSQVSKVFKFTNTKISFQYYCYIFVPLINITNFYGSMLDVALSLERVVILSNKLKWFIQLNQKVVCFVFAVIAFVLLGPFFTI